MALVYHVTTRKEWNDAKTKGFYTALSLETEGFIHTSELRQIEGVLQRYYQGKTGLIKLVIDTGKLVSELKYELAHSVNERFPHIYGPINLDAVIDVQEI